MAWGGRRFHCAITHPHELHGDQLEALLLETLDDLANQSTLDGIGLDHYKSALLVSGHVDSMEKNLLLRIPIGLGVVCECYSVFDMPCRNANFVNSGILKMTYFPKCNGFLGITFNKIFCLATKNAKNDYFRVKFIQLFKIPRNFCYTRQCLGNGISECSAIFKMLQSRAME